MQKGGSKSRPACRRKRRRVKTPRRSFRQLRKSLEWLGAGGETIGSRVARGNIEPEQKPRWRQVATGYASASSFWARPSSFMTVSALSPTFSMAWAISSSLFPSLFFQARAATSSVKSIFPRSGFTGRIFIGHLVRVPANHDKTAKFLAAAAGEFLPSSRRSEVHSLRNKPVFGRLACNGGPTHEQSRFRARPLGHHADGH